MDTLLIILLALTTVAIPALTGLRLPLTSSTHGGARGLREGAASRASPTIRKVPPSRVKTVKRAFGSGWQHTLGNNPVEPVLRRFRYRHAV
jgi:hypothetical protein